MITLNLTQDNSERGFACIADLVAYERRKTVEAIGAAKALANRKKPHDYDPCCACSNCDRPTTDEEKAQRYPEPEAVTADDEEEGDDDRMVRGCEL